MHPKTEIRPERTAIKRILDQGWAGQLKIHGHRAQIHIPADATPVHVYNRQGQFHAKLLPESLVSELRRIFGPKDGWTVLDAEWLKGTDRLFVFDILKREGSILDSMTYSQRWDLLPRVYSSESIETLPLLRTVDKCMDALEQAAGMEHVEGLVLRALNTSGFSDTSIIRCRLKVG
jgi:ATP-dependent DNA ligase